MAFALTLFTLVALPFCCCAGDRACRERFARASLRRGRSGKCGGPYPAGEHGRPGDRRRGAFSHGQLGAVAGSGADADGPIRSG